MRLSRYFLPVLKETPKEAEIVSHQLMLRAGLIRQQSAGIYAWLPLGLRVLNKVNRIIPKLVRGEEIPGKEPGEKYYTGDYTVDEKHRGVALTEGNGPLAAWL